MTPLPRLQPLNEDSTADQKWLAAALEWEAQEECKISVPAEPKRWHPDLVDLLRSIKEKRRTLADADEIQSWGSVSRARAVPIRTGRAQALRALAFANAVLLAAPKRGVEADLDSKEGRFRLKMHDTELHFAVREQFKKRLHKLTFGVTSKEIATGKLFVAIFRPRRYDAKNLNESSFRSLDSFTNTVFEYLYAGVIAERERRKRPAIPS